MYVCMYVYIYIYIYSLPDEGDFLTAPASCYTTNTMSLYYNTITSNNCMTTLLYYYTSIICIVYNIM